MPGFVLARLSVVAPVVLAAVLFAIPADEARAHNDNSATLHAETYPLHEAVKADDLDSVNHFITVHMADVNAKDDNGNTPLHHRSRASIASILIAAGADVNVKDDNGNTPLYGAASLWGHASVVSILIAAGADVNAKNNDGETPLYRAAYSRNASIVFLLAAAGADMNVKNNNGNTPLYQAAVYGRAFDISILIAAGADVNVKNNSGNTPLHHRQHASKASILIEAGADVNAKNNNGETPLHIVAYHGFAPIVSILIAAGADVNVKNNSGNTPLYESAPRHASIATILMAAGGHWGEVCAGAAIVNPAGASPPCLCESPNFVTADNCVQPSAESCGELTPPQFYSPTLSACAAYSECLAAEDCELSVESCGRLTPPKFYDSTTGECADFNGCLSSATLNRDDNICECAGAAVLDGTGLGCECLAPNLGTVDDCAAPSKDTCGGLTPPQFYDSAAGECAEFKGCLSGAILNRDDNICECTGAAVLDGTGLGCECLAPNLGTPGDCRVPSVENCGGLTPPKFYDSAAGECAEFKGCLSNATLNRDDNICECAEGGASDGTGLGCEFTLGSCAAANLHYNGADCEPLANCADAAMRNESTNQCECHAPNLGTPENCQAPSAENCGGLTPPEFYDETAGECAEFKSCLSSATLNQDENICECAGAAVLDGTGLGCECLAPNFGTVEDCQAPSAESCADFYDPPRFYDASAGECAGDLHPCHATAVRKDDNSGCECPPERQFSHGDPSGGSWRSRSTGYCVDKTYGIRRYSRFSCWSSEYREYEWYESIPNSAECVADHAPVAHDLGGWNSAIRANNPTIVAHFIAEHDKDPDSGIHYAVRYHSHLAASVMIENGVNVNHPRYSRAPLHDAVTYGGARMISVLLAANANPDAIDSGGDTPLHFAAKKSDAPEITALISLLLAGGANPNIRNNDDWHPLDLAYHGGNIRLSNGVFARTPKRLLMSALVVGGGNLAQPDGQDGNGDSPLHFETRAGRDEFVLWVLNRGANPDIANNKSETPMHHAAGDFSLPRVKLLAERGANPDRQDEDGDSPLHKIARGTDTANNTALISLLLDKGANPNLKNNDGWRPLDLAFDDGGARDPRFARRMLMLALIEGGAQWTSECSGGAIPNENYRGLAQVATYPECKCPAHISQRDSGGACECPGHSHSQVNGRCLPQGSAEVDAEIAKMQVELARLRAALVSLNARLSLSAEAPRETVEDIAEQARETAAEIDWRRANFVALGRRGEAGEAPPPVALSDTAAECRMRGGEVRIDSGSGTRICLGLDQSGTFCLVDSGDAFPCRGLFKHVRRCNDVYHRPALNAFICGARCGANETARGRGCE